MSRRFHHVTIAVAVTLFAAGLIAFTADAVATMRADLRMIERMDAGQ